MTQPWLNLYSSLENSISWNLMYRWSFLLYGRHCNTIYIILLLVSALSMEKNVILNLTESLFFLHLNKVSSAFWSVLSLNTSFHSQPEAQHSFSPLYTQRWGVQITNNKNELWGKVDPWIIPYISCRAGTDITQSQQPSVCSRSILPIDHLLSPTTVIYYRMIAVM